MWEFRSYWHLLWCTFWDDLFEHPYTQRGASDPLKDLPRCKPNEKPCLDPTGIYGCLDPTGVYCRPLTLNEYKN